MRDTLLDRRGHVLMQVLIILPLLYVALFLPFSFAVLQHKRSVLNDALELALQRAAVEGGLTQHHRELLLDNLRERGFDPAEISITPSVYVEKARGEVIRISISVPGHSYLLEGVRAIGSNPPPQEWQMTATGSIMSEKLP